MYLFKHTTLRKQYFPFLQIFCFGSLGKDVDWNVPLHTNTSFLLLMKWLRQLAHVIYLCGFCTWIVTAKCTFKWNLFRVHTAAYLSRCHISKLTFYEKLHRVTTDYAVTGWHKVFESSTVNISRWDWMCLNLDVCDLGNLGFVYSILTLWRRAGSTRFPLLSIMVNPERTRCDRYPHLNICHAM
jgi:hypothetical protein